MPNLLAISFEGTLAPSFDLTCLRRGEQAPDGWGIGYYPGGEPSASVLKEPAPPPGSIRSELIEAWEHLEASLFVLHIRSAVWGANTDANTQPFSRSYAGRDYLFGHAGSLKHRLSQERAEGPRPAFEPVGSTDTEVLFCELLCRIHATGAGALAEIPRETLHGWFRELNAHGSLTAVLTDGDDLVVYSDKDGVGAIHLASIFPPFDALRLSDSDLSVDLFRRGVKSRKGILVSTNELVTTDVKDLRWRRLAPGHLAVVRQGAVTEELAPPGSVAAAEPSSTDRGPLVTPSAPPGQTALVAGRDIERPSRSEPKRLRIVHRTVYKYTTPVERSIHLLRLIPAHDRLQTLLSNEVTLSVEGKQRDYDDVFGNRVRRIELETPFHELILTARSEVALTDVDPLFDIVGSGASDNAPRPRPRSAWAHRRSTIPLVWMPWQRHMLQPYLLPPELPDSELEELTEYAMSFVERNGYDLVDTLLDINRSIHREYAYKQGTTYLHTTAFDVYTHRRGVCQDFANLFICLARLLSVPARYVCGYVYTGPKHANQAQSEASHAWVQVYLPEVGWKGFDPTNGVLATTDHVRVAVGRSYVDATPTSGTIYVGGGGETLRTDVVCEVV